MLHKQTTPKTTFQLLEKLMSDPIFKDFALAGGTAISLYLGHRISIDLDLFSNQAFNTTELENYLSTQYNFQTNFTAKNTLKGEIDGVKIDCITFNYPFFQDIQNFDGVRLYPLPDIIAMKLLAIADNGTRLKDFIDIAFLSTKYSFEEMLAFAEYKFPNKNSQIFEKALLFHNDIIFSERIHLIDSTFYWEAIQKRLEDMTKDPKIIFEELPTNIKTKNNLKL